MFGIFVFILGLIRKKMKTIRGKGIFEVWGRRLGRGKWGFGEEEDG